MRASLSRPAATVKAGRAAWRSRKGAGGPSALTRLEALLRLVDDVDAALATHEAVVAVAIAQGFQRITDFHVRHQAFWPRGGATADKMKSVPMPQTAAAIKSVTKDLEQVTLNPGVNGAPSSRAERSDPGERRAPHVLLDRHAAARLAMTERPLSSEASDRALLPCR